MQLMLNECSQLKKSMNKDLFRNYIMLRMTFLVHSIVPT